VSILHLLLNKPSIARHRELIVYLWRFYSVSVLNTVFGYGVYALLVASGINLYIAQILSQLIGMTFNYFTYSRHVFRQHEATILRYVGAYISNYLMNLALLALFHQLFSSPYISGLLAVVAASLINLVVLKRLVFRQRQGGDLERS